MDKLSKVVKNVLTMENEYNNDISLYYEVISYIPYFQDVKEEDYIIYHEDNTFEYTPQFHSFIKSLFDAKLVEDTNNMKEFLKSYNSDSPYKLWMKDMNIILEDENLLAQANIDFLKKALLSIIRLEYILPGSWGIDVETGNWLKILTQLKKILPQIYTNENQTVN